MHKLSVIKSRFTKLSKKVGNKSKEPGSLLSAAYKAQEAKEKPHSKQTKAGKKHEAKESKAYEKAEHKIVKK